MLISLIVFGTTLYSCTDSNGTKTGNTEFVINSKDTVPIQGRTTIGIIAPPPTDTIKKKCSPNNKDVAEIMGKVAIFNPADTIKKITETVEQYKMGEPLIIDSTKNK